MINKVVWPLTAVLVAAIIATGGVLVARSLGRPSPPAAPASPVAVTTSASPVTPAPTFTRTVIRQVPVPTPEPNVTDPWAVVSAYYGDVESQNYSEAWALLSSGMVTGQTYGQFVAGYACTGAQTVTELGETGDQVSFDLMAVNDCTGNTQYYTGTDTVTGGKIVAAQITRTG